jgi:hypothetical protein
MPLSIQTVSIPIPHANGSAPRANSVTTLFVRLSTTRHRQERNKVSDACFATPALIKAHQTDSGHPIWNSPTTRAATSEFSSDLTGHHSPDSNEASFTNPNSRASYLNPSLPLDPATQAAPANHSHQLRKQGLSTKPSRSQWPPPTAGLSRSRPRLPRRACSARR